MSVPSRPTRVPSPAHPMTGVSSPAAKTVVVAHEPPELPELPSARSANWRGIIIAAVAIATVLAGVTLAIVAIVTVANMPGCDIVASATTLANVDYQSEIDGDKKFLNKWVKIQDPLLVKWAYREDGVYKIGLSTTSDGVANIVCEIERGHEEEFSKNQWRKTTIGKRDLATRPAKTGSVRIVSTIDMPRLMAQAAASAGDDAAFFAPQPDMELLGLCSGKSSSSNWTGYVVTFKRCRLVKQKKD